MIAIVFIDFEHFKFVHLYVLRIPIELQFQRNLVEITWF